MARTAKRKRPPQGRRHRTPATRPPSAPGWGPQQILRYATALLWIVVFVAVGSGTLRAGASIVFLLAAAAALVHFVAQALRTHERGQALRTAQGLVALLAVAGAVVVFDPLTLDTFNVPKAAVVVIGAGVVIVLVALERLARATAEPRGWRNTMRWPVLVLVGWTLTTTVTSSDRRMSLLGVYGSYNGVLTFLALVVIFFAVGRAVRAREVQRVLSGLWFSVGGLVILYGLIQLHDQLWGARWDWVRWGAVEFPRPIWSTVGNPNHLAGILAILLPIGLVMLALATTWPRRALAGGMVAALLLELLYTEGRGGWLGAGLALAVLATFWSPELRRRPRLLAAGAGALSVVIGVSIVVLGDDVDVGARVRSAFELSEGTQAQRIGQWEAAAEMVERRPVTGYGPETYRLHFNRSQSASFAEDFGADNHTAGSHNIFTDYAAMTGLPGLGVFLWLLGAAGRRIVRLWRAIRSAESAGHPAGQLDAGTARLLLGCITASLVAYVAQASFNLQQVALWAVFWLLLALLTVLDRAILPTNERAPRQQPGIRRVWIAAAGAVGLALAAAVAIVATMPWRADRHYREARISRATASQLADATQAAPLLSRSATHFDRSISLNRWEPMYIADSAGLYRLMADNAEDRAALELAEEAVTRSRRAVRLRPGSFELHVAHADALLDVDTFTAEGHDSAVREAIESLEAALRRNPHSDLVRARLESARARLRS